MFEIHGFKKKKKQVSVLFKYAFPEPYFIMGKVCIV
jgi:hypothetical protein